MDTLGRIMGYILVYAVLLVGGVKLYFWSRRLRKQYNMKWSRRLGFLFFFAPVLLFLTDLCIPLPQEWAGRVEYLLNIVDSTLNWLDGSLRPTLGFGYTLIKPIVSALVCAAFGFVGGWMLDRRSGRKSE